MSCWFGLSMTGHYVTRGMNVVLASEQRYEHDSQLVEAMCRNSENDAVLREFLEILDGPIGWNCSKFGVEYDDLLQEVMLQLCGNDWAKLRSWNRESSLRTWLSCVIHNLCLNLISSKRYRQTTTGKLPEELEDYRLDTRELDKAIDQSADFTRILLAIEKLPPEQAYVLTQKYIYSRSHEDIAQELGKTSNNIGVISHRALASLRKLLGVTTDA